MERGAGITKNVVREILNHRLCSLHPHIIQVRKSGPEVTEDVSGLPCRQVAGQKRSDMCHPCHPRAALPPA